MTSVIVDYMFKNVFLAFYTLQVGSPKRRWAWGNLPPTLPLDGPGCVNNVLISVF